MPVSILHEMQITAPPLPSPGLTREFERELVIRAKKGSADAFERLVERYERKIFRLAQNITRHREDAEDVAQNAFIKAFRNLARFRGDSGFYTWLVRITVNEALMKNRRRRFNEYSIDEPIEGEDAFIPREIQDWGPDPEQHYSQKELRELLAATIGELEPGYRAVFQLRDVEGFSIEETARTLGLSCPAVKTRLLRARMKLRNSLDEYFRANQIENEFSLAGAV